MKRKKIINTSNSATSIDYLYNYAYLLAHPFTNPSSKFFPPRHYTHHLFYHTLNMCFSFVEIINYLHIKNTSYSVEITGISESKKMV